MDYMREALRLARRGLGMTSPNPMVGAVVVKDGKIVGRGYHKISGESHAEIIALKEAKENAKGATLYVNLEPCCHWGKTPPCTQAIINAGIKDVHAARIDPSPWVNGKGIKQLEEAGVSVILGEQGDEARELNEPYFKWVKEGKPFVILKAAITLDGKIADLHGGSKWITNERSRRFVHRLRSQVDAVMLGIGTVIRDDPELTVRAVKDGQHHWRKNPKRIILDSKLRIPSDAKVLGAGCIIATCVSGFRIQNSEFRRGVGEGTEIWEIKKDSNGRVDILEVLKHAAKEGMQSILIEGGKEVFTESLKMGVVDKVYFFIAPKFIGAGVPVLGDLGIERIERALSLRAMKFRRFGEDILMVGSPLFLTTNFSNYTKCVIRQRRRKWEKEGKGEE